MLVCVKELCVCVCVCVCVCMLCCLCRPICTWRSCVGGGAASDVATDAFAEGAAASVTSTDGASPGDHGLRVRVEGEGGHGLRVED